jgi:hypothetical protein
MKILVTGDRDWSRLLVIFTVFLDFLSEYNIDPKDVIVIHGDCRGADRLCELVAKELGMKPDPYPANWTKYGRAAGPIRNSQMLKENPDIELAFAFHPDLDNSKGTKDMVEKLEKAKVPYLHFV